MRLISILLVSSSMLLGTPALADQAHRAAAEDVRRIEGESRSLRGPLEQFLAQAQYATPSPNTNDSALLDARIASLEQEKSGIRTRTPLVFTIIGIVLTGAGGMTALAGGFAKSRTLYITGGSLAAVGLPTLITGATIHGLRKAERRKIDREIDRLERQRTAATEPFDDELRPDKRRLFTLSWTF